jgi:hypothetical protein
MTATNLPLYRLLVKLGASEPDAEAAATTSQNSHLVTRDEFALLRADLRTEMADLRSDLLKWGVGLLFTALGLQTALVIFVLSRLVRP